MKKNITIITLAIILTACAVANGQIPEVRINDQAVNYQTSLYPDYYKDHSAINDLRWVRSNDSALVAFWEENSENILYRLSELSGINWAEYTIDIYLLRYYPSVGEADPLTIPLGGMRKSGLIEAAPIGTKMQLNLIYQLSHRMLAQAERTGDAFEKAILDHPLMQPGAYRRDNLAMLLALVVAQEIIGLDSTYDAYNSAFWKQRTPGREIFEQYLLNEWILSPKQPLANWIVNEPYSSSLVAVTRPPSVSEDDNDTQDHLFIEGLPLKGQLGFTMISVGGGRLQVDKIDIRRLGYACGLREGDQILRVDGIWPRSQKDLTERILDGLDKGGVTLNVSREGQSVSLLIQPMELHLDDESYYMDQYQDSVFTEPVDEGTIEY